MQRTLWILVLCAIAVSAGVVLGRLLLPSPVSVATDSSEPEILYWVAPMDPSYRREGPGKSPMGMDLVPVYAGEAGNDAGVVAIDPVVVSNLGVRTVPAEKNSLSRRIDTVGFVSYDESTIQHVHTRVEGWVESLTVKATGDPVSEGQLLFELYSPTLVNAQQEFLAALAGSNAELRRASSERLAALGMSDAEIRRLEEERSASQRIRFLAANDGVVANLGIREGIFVTPATEVLSIASLESVWVIAEVLERQAGWVEEGQAAVVTLDEGAGREFTGTIDYVYPELEVASRTLRARIRLDNPDTSLRPNMFAHVRIDGRATGPIVNIPKEAVIRSGDGNRVVVADKEGRFRVVPVMVGIESGDRVAIRSGLDEGERVVVSGQFLIDSESNSGSALERMTPADNHSKPQDDPHAGHDMSHMQ